MPIYEYRCNACGHQLDALQKVNDEPLKDCPACKEPALRRLISAPAFRLKGGGWYETDFKSDKERKRNLAEASESKPDDKAAAKGDETKPAADGKKADDKKPDSGRTDGKKSKESTAASSRGDKGSSSAVA
jgi:putative FmdB family regulatory protein